MAPSGPHRVKLAVADAGLARRIVELIQGARAFEIVDARDPQPAELWVVQLGPDAQARLSSVEEALKKGLAEEVFLVSETADPKILMQAMRIGVKEFLPLPLDAAEFKAALERFKERRVQAPGKAADRRGSVVSIFGSKGGVGTTTIAVNLAVSLAQGQAGRQVALLDMNTLFGEIPLFLEMAPKFHWGEITKNIDRLDSQFLQNTLTRHKTGVQVLPSPAYLNGHVRPTPEIMSRLLGLMRRMFDFVVIDAGQSTDDTSLKVLETSDLLMLVTILSLPCLANTNKLVRSLSDLGYVPKERIRVVLNRFHKRSEISIADAEAGIGKEIFWVVPNDYDTSMAAINSGKPLLSVAPGAAITKSLVELARTLADPGAAAAAAKKKGLI